MRLFTLSALLLAAALPCSSLRAQICAISKNLSTGPGEMKYVFDSGCTYNENGPDFRHLNIDGGLGDIDLTEPDAEVILDDLRNVQVFIGQGTRPEFLGSALVTSGTSFDFEGGGTNFVVKTEDGNFRVTNSNSNSAGNASANYTIDEFNDELANCPDVCTIANPSTSFSLPVTLLDWTAEATASGISLHWTTADEVDNDHFVLLHSRNGRDFEVLSTINGHGTTDYLSDYSYRHAAGSGMHYYRLHQVDFDGTTTDLGLRSVVAGGSAAATVLAGPNPVRSGGALQLRAAEGVDLNGQTAELFGPAGRLQYRVRLAGAELQLPRLAAGSYTLRVGAQTTRIVVVP